MKSHATMKLTLLAFFACLPAVFAFAQNPDPANVLAAAPFEVAAALTPKPVTEAPLPATVQSSSAASSPDSPEPQSDRRRILGIIPAYDVTVATNTRPLS